MRSYLNPAVRRDDEFRGLWPDGDYHDVRAFFRSNPELSPTPLKPLRALADTLGVASIYAKDETHRFGLNAFKIVGVSYAVDRLVNAGRHEDREPASPITRGVVCATAGNHGRAVARVAHQRRIPCTVFLPSMTTHDPIEARTRAARISAMQADGATVVDVDGTYEQAVRQAAAFGSRTGATIVSDTSWEGYERIPRWIMAGYTRLLDEAAAQWDAPPTLVIVQAGVGGLVCAAANWFAWRFGKDRPFFVAAEPDNAACLLMSARAGQMLTIDSDLDTIMAGLRCAEPSPAAWPSIAAGVDAFVAVPDALAREAMEMMRAGPDAERIEAGPSGACGVAALTAIARAPQMEIIRSAARLDRSARVMVMVTEGV